MIDREVKIELENEVGHLVTEEDEGNQTAQRHYILNQESELDVPYNMEDDDHDRLYSNQKLLTVETVLMELK